MLDLQGKKWYASMTFWALMLTVADNAYNSLAAPLGLPAIPGWVYSLLNTFGIGGTAWGIRRALPVSSTVTP